MQPAEALDPPREGSNPWLEPPIWHGRDRETYSQPLELLEEVDVSEDERRAGENCHREPAPLQYLQTSPRDSVPRLDRLVRVGRAAEEHDLGIHLPGLLLQHFRCVDLDVNEPSPISLVMDERWDVTIH